MGARPPPPTTGNIHRPRRTGPLDLSAEHRDPRQTIELLSPQSQLTSDVGPAHVLEQLTAFLRLVVISASAGHCDPPSLDVSCLSIIPNTAQDAVIRPYGDHILRTAAWCG